MGALRLCTTDAAAAIGLAEETGSLSPGKWADCVVLRPPPRAVAEDPAELALAAGPDAVRLTILGGTDVYRAGRFA
jgi:imidazolonepropionase-like amidohydrolase